MHKNIQDPTPTTLLFQSKGIQNCEVWDLNKSDPTQMILSTKRFKWERPWAREESFLVMHVTNNFLLQRPFGFMENGMKINVLRNIYYYHKQKEKKKKNHFFKQLIHSTG